MSKSTSLNEPNFFDNIIQTILAFHGIKDEMPNKTYLMPDGRSLAFSFPRATYENFIRTPALLAMIPAATPPAALPPPRPS